MRENDPELLEATKFSAFPAGPVMQVSPANTNLRVIPSTTDKQELAKDLVEYLMAPEFMSEYYSNAIYGAVLEDQTGLRHLPGEPGPCRSDRPGAQRHAWIIPGCQQRGLCRIPDQLPDAQDGAEGRDRRQEHRRCNRRDAGSLPGDLRQVQGVSMVQQLSHHLQQYQRGWRTLQRSRCQPLLTTIAEQVHGRTNALHHNSNRTQTQSPDHGPARGNPRLRPGRSGRNLSADPGLLSLLLRHLDQLHRPHGRHNRAASSVSTTTRTCCAQLQLPGHHAQHHRARRLRADPQVGLRHRHRPAAQPGHPLPARAGAA